MVCLILSSFLLTSFVHVKSNWPFTHFNDCHMFFYKEHLLHQSDSWLSRYATQNGYQSYFLMLRSQQFRFKIVSLIANYKATLLIMQKWPGKKLALRCFCFVPEAIANTIVLIASNLCLRWPGALTLNVSLSHSFSVSISLFNTHCTPTQAGSHTQRDKHKIGHSTFLGANWHPCKHTMVPCELLCLLCTL